MSSGSQISVFFFRPSYSYTCRDFRSSNPLLTTLSKCFAPFLHVPQSLKLFLNVVSYIASVPERKILENLVQMIELRKTYKCTFRLYLRTVLFRKIAFRLPSRYSVFLCLISCSAQEAALISVYPSS